MGFPLKFVSHTSPTTLSPIDAFSKFGQVRREDLIILIFATPRSSGGEKSHRQDFSSSSTRHFSLEALPAWNSGNAGGMALFFSEQGTTSKVRKKHCFPYFPSRQDSLGTEEHKPAFNRSEAWCSPSEALAWCRES